MSDEYLIDRTRKPAVVLAAEDDPARVVIDSTGRRQHDVRLFVDKETKERIQQERICAFCLEPFEEASPVECPVCKFPVREEQARYIAKHSSGPVRLGSRIRLADELERIREIEEYEDRTGILLPPGVRNPSGEL